MHVNGTLISMTLRCTDLMVGCPIGEPKTEPGQMRMRLCSVALLSVNFLVSSLLLFLNILNN